MTIADESPGKLRLLLIDDHRVFGESLAVAIDAVTCTGSVTIAHSIAEAEVLLSGSRFDVALVDLHLPDGDGFEVLTRLRTWRPNIRTAVLSADTRPDVIRRARAAGAAAFLGKDAPLASILTVVRDLHALGEVADVGWEGSADPALLTPREHEVVAQLGQGCDASQISERLGISIYTVRDHIRALMRKLDARTQLEAVVAAERLGIITVARVRPSGEVPVTPARGTPVIAVADGH